MYASQPHVFETARRFFVYMGLEIASIRIEAVAFVKDLFFVRWAAVRYQNYDIACKRGGLS